MAWVKKALLVLVLVVGFVLFSLLQRPESAAAAVRNTVQTTGAALRSVVTFFTSLAG